ncbi:MAG: TonB family protein [Sulfurimonas sp.]|jgi:protein TonB|nr:TonB family protein [Sulfurimonadaceae bacterium]
MKRYLNSFFITSVLYTALAGVFLYFLSDIKIEQKLEPTITKISLNSVELVQKQPKKPEPVVEEIVEPVVEEVVQKIVEKSAPKVAKKIVKKVEKKVKKVVEEPVQEVVQEEVTQKVVEVAEATPVMEVAQNAPEAKPEPVVDTGLENDYLAKVRAKIDKCKTYPKAAKRLKQHGRVVVAFDVLKDGKIENIKIVEASKFAKLDEASLKLLEKIAYFEAIPAGINRDIWNIQIPIVYQYN